MTPTPQPAREVERTAGDIIHARRKLCFKMAEAVIEHLEQGEDERELSAEAFARVIDMHLPMTHVEADAYMDEQRESWKRADSEPKKPSLPQQLREALHCTGDMTIGCMMQAAIDAVKERDQLRTAVDSHAALVEALEKLLTVSLPKDVSGQRMVDEARAVLLANK